MGIQGEGEEAFRLLLRRLEGDHPLAGVPGLYVKGRGLQGDRALFKDLDQFPFPETDPAVQGPSWNPDVWVPVQTRRGCPMDCTYCSTAAIEGRRVRKRSPEKVVEWITRLQNEGMRRFYFVDNTFNLPVPYAHKLCGELSRASLGVSWRCIVYPYRMSEMLAAAMAEAGCIDVSIGFESGCEEVLRSMNKRFSREDVRRTCTLLTRQGVRCAGFLLVGGPGETRQSIEESLVFADSLDLASLKITVGIRIYPHTVLAEHARKQGLITAEDDLLLPRFYMKSELKGWAGDVIAKFAESRPNWTVD
jgi:radical SAM superfamily enzyme YgiQ (UPF0313 family)